MAADQGVSRSPSLYRKVAEDIKAAIAAGGYAAGTRLPSESELAGRYSVSRGTIRQAFAALRADGVIASRRGARRWSSAGRGCRASVSCCRSPAGRGPWAKCRAGGSSPCSAGGQAAGSRAASRPGSARRSTAWSGPAAVRPPVMIERAPTRTRWACWWPGWTWRRLDHRAPGGTGHRVRRRGAHNRRGAGLGQGRQAARREPRCPCCASAA